MKKLIYGILVVLLICFIWGNSILSGEVSGAISHFFADILGGEQGATDEGHFLLRKMAHLTEFAFLGAVSALFFDSLTSDRGKKHLSTALLGVSVPLMDETIQIFSNRGYSLTDVWIDISGYSLGAAITLTVLFLKFKRPKKS